LSEINIDELITKATNKFLLSNAAAGRAKQISDGSLPYVNHFDPNSPVITALREIAAGKIKINILSGPSKKAQEIISEEPEFAPSALERLAKGAKVKEKKREKSKK